MNQANPYAPPAARVADIDSRPTDPPPFFAVSLLKFTILSATTGGLYEFYWFYRNWDIIKQREQRVINPIWRALFSVFYCYACISRVKQFEHPHVAPGRLQAGGLAAGWILFSLAWRLPEPYWLVSMLAFVFLLPVQRRANEINAAAAPGHDVNDRFTALNWIGMVIGAGSMVLAVADAFLLLE